MDDEGVAVEHDGHGQDKHDQQLVPGEDDPGFTVHIGVCAQYGHRMAIIVVVQEHLCSL